jgi:hypothetical protein
MAQNQIVFIAYAQRAFAFFSKTHNLFHLLKVEPAIDFVRMYLGKQIILLDDFAAAVRQIKKGNSRYEYPFEITFRHHPAHHHDCL